jgi:hypothetical protein
MKTDKKFKTMLNHYKRLLVFRLVAVYQQKIDTKFGFINDTYSNFSLNIDLNLWITVFF